MPASATDAPLIRDWAPALRAHRASRAACAERLKAISETCAASHGKAHALGCDDCRAAIVGEIRRRYTEGGGEEWFAGREEFRGEVGRMLDGAGERRVALSAVDARIAGEKRAWYRDVLRADPYFVNVALTAGNVTEFHRVLDYGSDEEIARLVREAIGPVRGGPIDAETYLSLSSPDSLKPHEDLTRLVFETDGGKVPEGVEPYADLHRAGTSIAQILATIDDRRAPPSADLEARARRAKEERASRRAAARDARRRLDELERARAAHSKILSKKTEEEDKRLRPEFFALGSCKACGGEVEGDKVVACSLCQVGVEMGVGSAQTVYCSMSCCAKAHESHVRESHTCTSGPSCLQHTPSPPKPETTLCKDCAHNQKSTAYCSPACADSNMRTHLEAAHPERARDAGGGAVDGAVVGLGEVHAERIGKKVKGAEFVEV